MTNRTFTGTSGFGNPVRTGETALRRLGIDWTVKAVDLEELTGHPGGDRFVASIRSSDDAIIGVNGTRHTVIQNQEMAELADAVMEMNSSFTVVGGGAFPNGDKTYMVLKSDHVLTFGQDDDRGFSNIMLVNDFNGNSPLVACGFLGRFFCTNQIAGITKRQNRLVSVTHTKSKDWKIVAAKDTLRAAVHEMDELERELQRLLETEMAPARAEAIAIGECPTEKIDDDGRVTNRRAITEWERRLTEFRSEYNADYNDHLKGTALGAVMAGQGMDEHLSRSLDRDVSRVNRVMDANFPTMHRVLAAV